MEKKGKSPVSMGRSAALGVTAGVLLGAVIVMAFGLVAHRWLMGVLAGVCCCVGAFLCVFAWTYLKAVERYYKAHPELLHREEDTPPGNQGGE